MSVKTLAMFLVAVSISICSEVYGQRGFGDADANQDQKIDATELEKYVSRRLPRFKQFDALFREMDADQSGSIDEKEFATRMAAARRVMGGQPRMATRSGAANQRPSRQRAAGLKVGEDAPTFKLKSLDGKSETDLAAFKGKKPIVLIFGSYS